ncbi:MAG TPA: hypothetical protein VN026_07710, partial [Bacteroidia bacterium]|nr:hypothetical protein [Bacteroidia bacterium]
MKKIYSSLFALIFSITINAQCPTFTINAPSGNVVGCSPTTVPLNAVNTSTLSGVTYTWIGSVSGNTTGVSINATGPNTYSVYASCPSSTCTSMQTISIFQSTVVPSTTVTPISQTLTCNAPCKSFTATNFASPNIVGNWFNPDMSPMTGLSVSPIIMCANAKGIYTAQFCNIVNGCCTSQTVSVSSNTPIPTISVTSVFGGYTINCTKPCLPMQISSSGTIAPITYTWINLATSASVTPAAGGYTICTPGQYEAQFSDGNNCHVSEIISVEIDTIKPSPFSSTSLSGNSYTVNCFTPSLVATALTNPMFSASSYSWTQPPNLIINSNTISIGIANITSSTTPTTYTVSAFGANGCVGRAKVNFYKDVYVPFYTAVFTPSAITCSNPTIAMSPSGSSTVPVTYTFTSPAPTTTANTAGATFSVAGTYTMGYTNINNGCTVVTTTNVPLNITPPATFAVGPYYIPCGSFTTGITAGTNSTTGTYSYNWSGPFGSSMSCAGGVGCYATGVNMG